MHKKVDVVLITLTSPIKIGVYENAQLVETIEDSGRSSDVLPLIFEKLLEKYTSSLKENALVPYIENNNFRRAVKDFGSPSFKTYDNKLKKDIEHVLKNMVSKFNYTELGAKQIALYVLDKKLPSKF